MKKPKKPKFPAEQSKKLLESYITFAGSIRSLKKYLNQFEDSDIIEADYNYESTDYHIYRPTMEKANKIYEDLLEVYNKDMEKYKKYKIEQLEEELDNLRNEEIIDE